MHPLVASVRANGLMRARRFIPATAALLPSSTACSVPIFGTLPARPPRAASPVRLLHTSLRGCAAPRVPRRALSGRAADGSVRLPSDEQSEAFEVIAAHPTSSSSSSSSPSVLVTCEHASDAMPEPYSLPQADSALQGTHWQCDLGAADLTRELCSALSSPGLMSRCSRLVVDVNRPLQSDTLMRSVADGRPVQLNTGISPHAFEDRISRFYLPYHRRMQQLVQQHRPHLVLSVHSFTADYEGQRRRVEVGVLYRRAKDEPWALRLLQCFREAGFVAEINEPWSGLLGFMYAMDSLTAGHPTAAPVLAPPFTTAVATQPSTRFAYASGGHSEHRHSQPPTSSSPRYMDASSAPADPSSSSPRMFPELTLMIECRQDLLEQPDWRRRCVQAISKFVQSVQSDEQQSAR